jgi:hypothetical protein
MRKLFVVPAVAGTATLALVSMGCGTKTIDTSDLQNKLSTQLAAAAKAPKPKISCPKDQEVKKGTTFNCSLTNQDGTKHTVAVTLTNDDGGYTAKVTK